MRARWPASSLGERTVRPGAYPGSTKLLLSPLWTWKRGPSGATVRQAVPRSLWMAVRNSGRCATSRRAGGN
jgi:hypothetical protein